MGKIYLKIGNKKASHKILIVLNRVKTMKRLGSERIIANIKAKKNPKNPDKSLSHIWKKTKFFKYKITKKNKTPNTQRNPNALDQTKPSKSIKLRTYNQEKNIKNILEKHIDAKLIIK